MISSQTTNIKINLHDRPSKKGSVSNSAHHQAVNAQQQRARAIAAKLQAFNLAEQQAGEPTHHHRGSISTQRGSISAALIDSIHHSSHAVDSLAVTSGGGEATADHHPGGELVGENKRRSSNRKSIKEHFTSSFQYMVKRISDGNKEVQEADYEDSSAQIARYKPKPIEELVKATRFTKKEIQIMYRGFKQECPSGIVNEQMFKEIYSQFFPQGDCGNYAHYVFTTIDTNADGTVNFEDFLMGLSILSRGTMDEKLRWIFNLYDINRDGKVTKDELFLIVSSIYELMGKYTHPPIDDELPRKHVDGVFKKLNPKQDGFITMDDFLKTCYNDEAILNSISQMDTLL